MRQDESAIVAIVMFFFFETQNPNESTYWPGLVCRLKKDSNRKVVIHEISGRTAWVYENIPVRYRINSKGRLVIDFDPSCVLSPCRLEDLEPTDDPPLQKDGWGRKHRENWNKRKGW